jgi:transposase
VQPKLGARVRLLATGNVNKNDPNDARSVAVAALRSPAVREARADDHAAVLKVWPERHRDLGSARTQVVCRLHAVLCELVPGGVPKKIIAPHAARLLDSVKPPDAVAAARWELAAALIEDLRRIGAQLRDTRKKPGTAVRASGTTLTGLFGIGPVTAAVIIGEVRDASRFKNRDHFAACNGTAPIEVASGGRKACRLSRRGNRRDGHAIHMAAVTQVRQPHGEGRACYDKKLAEGKTRKEALRALKRQVSDAVFTCLQADARRARARDPGGQQGNGSAASAAGSHPKNRLFGQATPGPSPHPATPAASQVPGTTGHSPIAANRPRGRPRNSKARQLSHSAEDRHVQQPSTLIEPLDTKRHSICSVSAFRLPPAGGVPNRLICVGRRRYCPPVRGQESPGPPLRLCLRHGHGDERVGGSRGPGRMVLSGERGTGHWAWWLTWRVPALPRKASMVMACTATAPTQPSWSPVSVADPATGSEATTSWLTAIWPARLSVVSVSSCPCPTAATSCS